MSSPALQILFQLVGLPRSYRICPAPTLFTIRRCRVASCPLHLAPLPSPQPPAHFPRHFRGPTAFARPLPPWKFYSNWLGCHGVIAFALHLPFSPSAVRLSRCRVAHCTLTFSPTPGPFSSPLQGNHRLCKTSPAMKILLQLVGYPRNYRICPVPTLFAVSFHNRRVALATLPPPPPRAHFPLPFQGLNRLCLISQSLPFLYPSRVLASPPALPFLPPSPAAAMSPSHPYLLPHHCPISLAISGTPPPPQDVSRHEILITIGWSPTALSHLPWPYPFRRFRRRHVVFATLPAPLPLAHFPRHFRHTTYLIPPTSSPPTSHRHPPAANLITATSYRQPHYRQPHTANLIPANLITANLILPTTFRPFRHCCHVVPTRRRPHYLLLPSPAPPPHWPGLVLPAQR
eukprot:scaffold23622_cov184-Amphora_coffeaeformis.AAC.1